MSSAVACLDNDQLKIEIASPDNQRSARSLVPTIQRALDATCWLPSQIDLVAVTVGPGSFTGLRVGVTAAKSFAYATGANVVGVNTLDVIANQALTGMRTTADSQNILNVVMNAQRKQYFWRRYQLDRNEWMAAGDVQIIGQSSCLEGLTAAEWVTGPGLDAPRKGDLTSVARVVDASLWLPTAVAVGLVGLRQFSEKGADDMWQLAPTYIRKSAAEEKQTRN